MITWATNHLPATGKAATDPGAPATIGKQRAAIGPVIPPPASPRNLKAGEHQLLWPARRPPDAQD